MALICSIAGALGERGTGSDPDDIRRSMVSLLVMWPKNFNPIPYSA